MTPSLKTRIILLWIYAEPDMVNTIWEWLCILAAYALVHSHPYVAVTVALFVTPIEWKGRS